MDDYYSLQLIKTYCQQGHACCLASSFLGQGIAFSITQIGDSAGLRKWPLVRGLKECGEGVEMCLWASKRRRT